MKSGTGVVVATMLALVGRAGAQLTPGQVLVVYDSRIPDSLGVAEYYAGSAKVPGGVGGQLGVRRGVNVVNLANLGGAMPFPGDILYADYKSRVRDPLRSYLTSSGLVERIRCIVLTKGLPHRIQDTDSPAAGDNPGIAVTEVNASDYNAASVDSELALLFQDLDTGEAGGASDSKADGMILNPYWKSGVSMAQYSPAYITRPKLFASLAAPGPIWNASSTNASLNLSPGDMYLVCRLDGGSVQNVKDMIDRAQGLVVNVNTCALLLDEDGQQLDNLSAPWPAIYAGDDYNLTNTLLTTDDRFLTAAGPTTTGPGVNYNGAAGFNNFYIGPNLSFVAGSGPLVTDPVLLLATYGRNHNGVPGTTTGGDGGVVACTSFNYSPGAIFNTIESYNCRDFGGLGIGGTPQQQASAFIASGGTFALGNVQEPFGNTVPDNLFLTRNFVLGGLTWAEAAWSSIPTISWMQIVVGDPLARMDRSCEDLTGDVRVDIEDLQRWESLPTGTASKDLNRDGLTNATDRNMIVRTLRQGEMAGLVGRRR